MTGLILGSDDEQIAQLEKIGVGISDSNPSGYGKWNTMSLYAFEGLTDLGYIVIGSGTANTEIGRLAFDRTTHEEDGARKMPSRIYFTGTKPRIGFGAFYNHIDRNPKTSVFVIRKGQIGWENIVTAAKANSTTADETAFATAFADKGLEYIGVVPTDPVYDGIEDVVAAVKSAVPLTESTYFGNSAPQYLAYGSFRTENNDIEVRNVMPDGTYLES